MHCSVLQMFGFDYGLWIGPAQVLMLTTIPPLLLNQNLHGNIFIYFTLVGNFKIRQYNQKDKRILVGIIGLS